MTSSSISSPPTDPWVQLVELCDPLVLHAPKTWGDPFCFPSRERPPWLEAVARYLQKHVVGRPWCNHLILFVVVFSSQNVQYRTVKSLLGSLHRGLEDLFSSFDLQSMEQWEVDRYLALYLSGQVLAEDPPTKRILFWRNYQTGSRLLKRWLASLPSEEQEKYEAFVFPYPQDCHELTRLSGEQKYRQERREKRKEETDAIMPFYADLRTQAHIRYNLLTRLRKAYHQAIKTIEEGKAHLPLSFEIREGGSTGDPQDPRERLVFKLWDRRTFVLAHPDDFSYMVKWEVRHHVKTYSDEKNSYLLEWMQEPQDEHISATRLWFLELLEQGALGSIPLYGTPAEIAEKQAWLRAQGYGEEEKERELLAPFRTDVPGLLFPSRASGDIYFMKYAQEHMGLLLIPIEPFWIAATFGMVALYILTANGMRIGELQQLQASPDCIIPLTIAAAPDAADQTPSIHWAVRAVPKGHHLPATYYLNDEHLRLLARLKLMLCEHYQLDPKNGEDLPIVPLLGSNKHRFQPARYLFQYNHKCLTDGDIRICLRFVMHGLVFQTQDERRVVIRPHLLRHGFATWALNVAKEPLDIVARILNQKNIDITKYYGRPNPRLIAERSHGLMTQISSYINVEEAILRSPEELRELLKKAKQTHGTLARVRGGRCLLSGECPIFFACVGCSAKFPDPAQRGELEELEEVTLIQIERAKKKGLTLEMAQHQKKLQQCRTELREMEMIEACRQDEQREPEVKFDVEA